MNENTDWTLITLQQSKLQSIRVSPTMHNAIHPEATKFWTDNNTDALLLLLSIPPFVPRKQTHSVPQCFPYIGFALANIVGLFHPMFTYYSCWH